MSMKDKSGFYSAPSALTQYEDSDARKEAKARHERELADIAERERRAASIRAIEAQIERLEPLLEEAQAEVVELEREVERLEEDLALYRVDTLYSPQYIHDQGGAPRLNVEKADFTLGWVSEVEAARGVVVGVSPIYTVFNFPEVGSGLVWSPFTEKLIPLASLSASVRFCVEFGLKQVGDGIDKHKIVVEKLVSLSEIDEIKQFVSDNAQKTKKASENLATSRAKESDIQDELDEFKYQLESME